MLEVGETGGAIQLGAAVRVAGERVDSERGQRQEEAVAGGEKRFSRHAAHRETPTGCFGSVTSVNRISSGSSTVTRLTV